MTKPSAVKIKAFRKAVWDFYKRQGRNELPWRETRDAYKILVSEVMLQQTQVERVVRFYERFIKAYPNANALAAAPLADVLKQWQGLGYNRRAKMLHEAAKAVARAKGNSKAKQAGSAMPRTIEGLEALPGVGHYTARAVAAFAYDMPSAFIETNIRTAVFHHFYPRKKAVSDAEVLAVVEATMPQTRANALAGKGAREWCWALMDYGSALKRSGAKLNAKSKHYAKQSAFEGSYRQARGALLRALLGGPLPSAELLALLGPARSLQAKSALASLTKEGMVELARGRFRLPR